MKLQKTQLAAAVGVALLAVGGTAFGQAAPTVQVYGQVSRTLMFADDGRQSKWFNVDNEASGTRLGVTGGAPVMPGLRAGFRLEWDFQSNESQRATFSTTGPVGDNPAHLAGTGFSERHADAWLEGAWGRVNLGQGDGAANGATESDLSGTGMANGIGVADIGGGVGFRTSTGGQSISINGAINQQDFESRYDRLMYTTPTFSGFRAQVSYGGKSGGPVGTLPAGQTQATGGTLDVKEIALWYGGKLGGIGELAAALGWSEKDATAPGLAKDTYIGGSISWLHGSGLNLTYSYSKRETPTAAAGVKRDSTFNYLKIGYKFGTHAIGVDYATGDDFSAVGDEAKMYGIGYVWNPIRWLELYAGYKVHQLDRSAANGGSMDDITIGHVGTRIRF